MNKHRIRLIINIIIAVVVIGAWLQMFLSGRGALSQDGFTNMKFYTVLSNQLEGAASILWIISLLRSQGRKAAKDWVEVLKYIATVSVFLTFTIVLGFLGPLYGLSTMYVGANFWFHLIIPLLAVIEMVFLSDYRATKRDNRLAAYLTILYGLVYLGNNLINGIESGLDGTDWYGFLLWGYPVGILIFIGISALTWALGRLIRFAHQRVKNEH